MLLLDQAHKYPEWDKELWPVTEHFSRLQIIFTSSSIVRIKSNPYLNGVVDMYNLSGLSFPGVSGIRNRIPFSCIFF